MDEPMNFHAAAPKIPPRILCIGMPVRDLTFRVQELPARGFKVNASHFDEICGGNALNATIGIARLGGRASICGPMGDAGETSAKYIFDKLAHEGIDTKHIVHMPGLVTPISNIMIDPSGERTIVTFRDPDLWKVHLPDAEELLDNLCAPGRNTVAVEFASCRRGNASCINQIFQSNWYAVKWAAITSPPDLFFRQTCLREGLIGGDRDERVQSWIEGVDPLQAVARHLHGGNLSQTERFSELDNRLESAVDHFTEYYRGT